MCVCDAQSNFKCPHPKCACGCEDVWKVRGGGVEGEDRHQSRGAGGGPSPLHPQSSQEQAEQGERCLAVAQLVVGLCTALQGQEEGCGGGGGGGRLHKTLEEAVECQLTLALRHKGE